MRKKQLPAGTHDKLFRRAHGVYQLEAKINEFLNARSFQRIETPTIEFAEVFEDEHNQDDLYRLFDHQGRLLTLRPDMTLPVGRVVASTKVELPLKLMYSGKVFRYHDEMKGLQNEFTQAGVEIIGFTSIKAEVEAILTAESLLRTLNVPAFHIEIGHAGIFSKIVDELGLAKCDVETLKLHLLNKSITDLYAFTKVFPSVLDQFIAEIPKLFGNVETVLKEARHLLPENHPILADLTEIETLYQLFPTQTQKILAVDLGMVGTMDYYTGIMFSSYSEGIPENFLSGGRYDYLFKRFDMPQTSSVGWAINLESVFDLLFKQKTEFRKDKVLLHFNTEDANKAAGLVSEKVELSLFDTLDETCQFASKWQYDQVWYFEDNNLIKQEVNHD